MPIYVSAVTELELFAYSDLSAEEESLIDDSEVLEKKLRRFDHRRQVFGQPISFAGRNQNGHGHLGQRAHDASQRFCRSALRQRARRVRLRQDALQAALNLTASRAAVWSPNSFHVNLEPVLVA